MGFDPQDRKLIRNGKRGFITGYRCYCDKCGIDRGYFRKKYANKLCKKCANSSIYIKELRRKSCIERGLNKYWLGKKHSDESRFKMSEAQKGEKHYNWKNGISYPGTCIDCGVETCTKAKYCRKCYKGHCSGKDNGNYKGESVKTKLSKLIRTYRWYKNWVKAIFERDNYTCQYTHIRGGSLHVHHEPKEFNEILTEEIVTHNNDMVSIIEAIRIRHLDLTIGKTVNADYHIHTLHHNSGYVLRRIG